MSATIAFAVAASIAFGAAAADVLDDRRATYWSTDDGIDCRHL